MMMRMPMARHSAVALDASAVTMMLTGAAPARLPRRMGGPPAAVRPWAYGVLDAQPTALRGPLSPFSSCLASARPTAPHCPFAPTLAKRACPPISLSWLKRRPVEEARS